MESSTRLDGRTLVVTGAGGDIGGAVARECAARGARVLLTDLPSDRLLALAEELDTPSAEADITDEGETRRALNTLTSTCAVDGLVAAAGMNTRTPILDLPVEEWDRAQAVNLRGTFLVSQAVARLMVRDGRPGSMVMVGSIGAWQPYPGLSHYEVAKAGAHALVRAWAVALAPHNIRVNAVAPGVVDTTMTRATLADPAKRRDRLGRIPLNRFGTPEDIAEAVCYLLAEASAWTTGTIMTVDGGQTIGAGLRSDPDSPSS